MKKHSKTTTVYRINLENGKYTTISRAILMNPELKDSAKTLLQLILNNIEGWKLRLSYYRKELKWSNDKMAAAVANLIENGYLRKTKHSKGKDEGFYYTYIISEFGNLNPNREQVEETEVLHEEEGSSEEELTEVKEVMPYTEPQQEPAEIAVPKIDLFEELKRILGEEIKYSLDYDYMEKAVQYYLNQLETKAINGGNFNEDKIRRQLQESIKKSNERFLSQLESWIDLHNDRGTKDQRANIKAKALIRLQEDALKGIQVDEKAVRRRLLYLKSSVIDSNKDYDSRYQD